METNVYYSVGDINKIVVSNSYAGNINPEEGGSPQKFLNAYKEKEEEKKESKALISGKLIHAYIENKDQFSVADIEIPTGTLNTWIPRLVASATDFKNKTASPDDYDISTYVQGFAKSEAKREAEAKQLELDFEKLGQLLRCGTENAIRAFRKSRIEEQAYMAQYETTIAPKLVAESEYINYLFNSMGKIALTKEVKEKVEGAIQSLELHPQVSRLLGLGSQDFDNPNEVFKELPIFWDQAVKPLGDEEKTVLLSLKALLDRLEINFSKKIIMYTDLKSTSGSLYMFQSSMEHYRYYRQMAFYARAIEIWFKSKYPTQDINTFKLIINMVPVETNGLFLTGIYRMSRPWLYKGKTEMESLLRRIAYHEATDYELSYEERVNGYLSFTAPVATMQTLL